MIPRRCTWKDWPKVRLQYQLRVMEVIMGEGTETTFVVKSGLMPEFEPVNSKLGAALAAMVADVEKNTGTPQRLQGVGEANSLQRIEAIRDLDGSFRLQIGREDGVPSEQEWKTVLAHLPYRELAPIEPETFSYKKWNYLRGSWKGNVLPHP